MNKYTFENGVLEIETPKGNIVVRVKLDNYYPGVDISLKSDDAIGVGINGESALAMVEFSHTKNTIQTIVFEDGLEEEPSHIIEHKNIYKDFKIKYTIANEETDFITYDVVISKGDNKYSYKFDLGKNFGKLTDDIILESIADDYRLYIVSPTLKSFIGNVGDSEDVEKSYETFKNDMESLEKILGKPYLRYLAECS